MYMQNYIQDCQGKSRIRQEEDSFHQETGLQFKEETSKVAHLEHSFVWCWNVDTSESRSGIPENFWNVVLANDGPTCEKRKYDTE